jgi:zinc transport system substrate-binding protein
MRPVLLDRSFIARKEGRNFALITYVCIAWSVAIIPFSPSSGLCRGNQKADPLRIYVVNYPLKYFTQRIGGDYVEVMLPVPSGTDPAYWIPDIATVEAYQQADLILLNGARYAKWVDKVTLPRSKVINTTAKLKDRYIRIQGAITHSHGQAGEHAHEGIAFTTWLDFDVAAKQAAAVAKALARKRHDLREVFEKNYGALEKDLMALDRDIKAMVASRPSPPLLASHPVYDYFAGRYGLNIKSLHWEPDEVPSAEQMMELQNMLRDHPAKWMIWEDQPLQESVERLKKMGIRSVVFDPCGNRPDAGDFMAVMKSNLKNLRTLFR